MTPADSTIDTPDAPELLAPAGDMAALRAALAAGASAVYFGMRMLNARRQARNFGQEELAQAVELTHAAGARAYLTLNVDLAERDLTLAAKMLVWAEQCGVDAVLVRDPALLALRHATPKLEIHFSTQSCMTNRADIEAAAGLGVARVVLAREMSLAEIAAASQVEGVETEVFAQGALCFCVSGRCLLSSWVGGRSGNRGMCASPCRVPWSADGQPIGTPLSMHDLASIEHVDALRTAGVAALKIEGRMKTSDWVGKAVALYRRALDGETGPQLREQAQQLGDYTGRQLTSGFLDGVRTAMTGESGRRAAAEPSDRTAETGSSEQDDALDPSLFHFHIEVADKIECRCTSAGKTEQWAVPKTVVRRKHKAVEVGQFLKWLGGQTVDRCRPGRLTTNDPSFLLVPRAANKLFDTISAMVRRARKRAVAMKGVSLPAAAVELLAKTEPAGANRQALNSTPDRVRLEASEVDSFVRGCRPRGVIVERMAVEALADTRRAMRNASLVVALPAVFYDDDIPPLTALLNECKRTGVPAEVNSWGGLRLARQAGVRIEGGPGLGVLNSLAARQLAELGLRSVTMSIEADRRQIEAVVRNCPVPLSIVVFGRPPLMTTRVDLSDTELRGRVLADRRDVRMQCRAEDGLWVFRPVDPFDLRGEENQWIRAAHLVVDLIGSPDAAGDYHRAPVAGASAFRFNYDRSLA